MLPIQVVNCPYTALRLTMTVGNDLQILADMVKELEIQGHKVNDIGDITQGGEFSSELTVSVSILDNISTLPGVELSPFEATIDETGSLVVSLSINIEESASSDATERRTQEVYKDPARLEEVYEEYDTFKDMRDALSANVTPKTVRNHMVKHGIHEIGSDTDSTSEPNGGTTENPTDAPTPEAAYVSSDESDTDSETTEAKVDDDEDVHESDGDDTHSRDEDTQTVDEVSVSEVIADGAGFPEDITLVDLKEAIQTSRTLYEVQQSMELGRSESHQILESLNLLDLVYGRVSTAARDISAEDIDERIRSSPLFEDLEN